MQTASAMPLRLCRESLASSELQHRNCEDNLPSPFSGAEDSRGVDVTGRAVHQHCGRSLKDDASQCPLGLSRDESKHLLVTCPRAILSTEDLGSLGS